MVNSISWRPTLIAAVLAEEHTTTCLIDDTISQSAEVLDLPAQLLDGHVGEHVLAARRAGPLEPRACVSYDLLGNVDEHPVRVCLLLKEPSSAGQSPAAWLCSQRTTSDEVSNRAPFIPSVCQNAHVHVKQNTTYEHP